jgi:hypothetical protein
MRLRDIVLFLAATGAWFKPVVAPVAHLKEAGTESLRRSPNLDARVERSIKLSECRSAVLVRRAVAVVVQAVAGGIVGSRAEQRIAGVYLNPSLTL